MKLACYVQHLRGAGHLVRTLALASASAQRGHHTQVLSGGLTPSVYHKHPEVRLIELPPLQSTPDFSQLLDAQKQPPSAEYFQQRLLAMQTALSEQRPDILIIESWPLARNALNDELCALIDWLKQAQPRCQVICSVRDMLEPKRDKRAAEMLARFHRYIDALVVHGQPALLRISDEFPALAALEPQAFYSGYIDTPTQPEREVEVEVEEALALKTASVQTAEPVDDVLVSVGSGGLDQGSLLTLALAAAEQRPEWRWRFLVGDAVARELRGSLSTAPSHVRIEPNRRDYRALLSRAQLSLSRFGYNTALDLAQCAQRALVVPVTQSRQTEQLARAKRFAAQGFVRYLEEPLSVESLLLEMDQLLASPPQQARLALDVDGANHTIQWLEQRLSPAH